MWRCWFTEEDTEASIERKARTSLGILGNWQRQAFWRDHEGILLVMTNSRKQVPLRYRIEDEAEVREIQICQEDTPKSVLTRLKQLDNYFILDPENRRFETDDKLFAFATTKGVQPVRIRHGVRLSSIKARVRLDLRDNREKVEDNNTFTWPGPRGVVGCIEQARVARLGQRPLSQPIHPVPLNQMNRRTTRKPPRRKKITTQVWEG
jgi:hypothetical protein